MPRIVEAYGFSSSSRDALKAGSWRNVHTSLDESEGQQQQNYIGGLPLQACEHPFSTKKPIEIKKPRGCGAFGLAWLLIMHSQ